MPIILIASNSPEAGEEIAKKVLKAKDYKQVDNHILSDIEAAYHIEAGKLSQALEEKPFLLKKMLPSKWQYYLACIEADVLNHLREDNSVCWGLAAHLYVAGVSHALKVRVIHNNHLRIEHIAEQQGISIQKAGKWLDMESRKREKWSLAAYNRNEADPSQYDLVINLDQIDVNEAVVTITGAMSYRKFQPNTYSIKCLSDLALAAKVKTTLLTSMNNIRVQARDDTVQVFTKIFKQNKMEKVTAIKDLAGKIDGVGCVEVHVLKNLFGDTAENVSH